MGVVNMSLERRLEEMENERLVVLNDIHVPFHDTDTLSAVYSAMKDMKPDRVVLAGDVCDFYSVSRFDKDPSRRLTLQDEVERVRTVLGDMRKKFPNAKFTYIPGNHEERLQKYVIRNAPELFWIEQTQLKHMLGLPELDMEFIPRRWWTYRGVVFSHMDRANKYGGYTARNIGSDLGKHVVHTHTHKVGHVAVGDTDFYDNGCLCDLDPEYLQGPAPWRHAFMVVDYIDNIPYFTQVPITDHQFVFNGKLYVPKKEVKRPARKKR